MGRLTKTHRTTKLGRKNGGKTKRTHHAKTKTRTGGKNKKRSKSHKKRGGMFGIFGFDKCCNSHSDCKDSLCNQWPSKSIRCSGYNGICTAKL